MPKIGVTGGLGFIGTTLVPRLSQAFEADIRVLDNASNPSGDLQLRPTDELIEADVRDRDALDRFVDGLTSVVHLAADTRVMDSIEDPSLNFEVNTIGTFRLLEAMRKAGVQQFVNASTGGAILGEVPPPIHEEIPAKPASPYGASKLAGEAYCSAYAQSFGFDALSLRFSNIYGPHSRNKGSVVAAFIKQILSTGQITVYGDGEQTRDYLFVEDLADGIIQALKTKVTGVYQLGSGIPKSVNTLIDILRNQVGEEFTVSYEPARTGEIVHTHCDISKAKQGFGYAPTTTLESGVAKTLSWFEGGENR